MYLIFDTETTGLPINYKAPLSDFKNWPRMVQLAWMSFQENGQLIESQNLIIKPDGFTIPAAAVKVHGISTERALTEGISLNEALTNFATAIEQAKFLIAHNIKFDANILGAEFLRTQIPNKLFDKPHICTMKKSTNFCQLPGNYGYKWPSLTQLHLKLFKSDFQEAHNAQIDVQACAKCFFELKRQRII